MNLRFLDTIVAVIEGNSVAEAARRLNLTPAGVAQRIQALEAEIGTRLIMRSGHTVRPTPAAVAILERARRIQREVRDLRSVAAGGLIKGELRLGVIQTMLGFVPDILSRFTAAYPQVDVILIRRHSADAYRAVLNGEVDAAITSHPSFALPKACEWQTLREEPFVVITPASAKRRPPHHILATEPFIRLDREVHAGRAIDKYLTRHGIRPRERFEMDGIDVIAVMVDRGLGVSLLPDYAPPWPEGLKLRKIALPDRSLTRRIGLLWLRGSLRAGLVNAFLDHARHAQTKRSNNKPKHGNVAP